jgi:hypothetical protein
MNHLNFKQRAELLLALTAALDAVIDKEMSPSWGLIYIPQELGYLMAQAAIHVIDVVITTEQSMDEAELLVVDENGVAI